jgi:cobalt-zinc-cadmium efflux system membrane fusion protein
MEASADGGAVVKVMLTAEEFNTIDPTGPAFVIPFDLDDAEDSDDVGFSAELDEIPGMDDDEDSVMKTMYYSVGGSDLVPDQRLMVEVSLKDESGPRLVVPFSSLIYDIYGGTWVYVNTEDLQFLRVPVVVDYIYGDKVVLNEGPDVGTAVVTVGVAELHGTDTGVGK